MEIIDSSGTIHVTARAKINLFLEVLGRRPDGYHDLDSIFHEIDFADEVTLTEQPEVRVVCSDSSIGERQNLATVAAQALRAQTGTRRGARIEITKRIPPGSGLGGGSSDAAAVLAGLNRLWELDLDPERLARIGAEVGSDVPFFFHGGTALVRGRGEQVTPIESATPGHFVLVFPPFSISTQQVYENLMLDLTSPPIDGISMVRALRGGRLPDVGRLLFNRLQPVAVRLFPALQDTLDKLTACQTCGVLMSGSGSALFALHDDPDAARETCERIGRETTGHDVYITASAATR